MRNVHAGVVTFCVVAALAGLITGLSGCDTYVDSDYCCLVKWYSPGPCGTEYCETYVYDGSCSPFMSSPGWAPPNCGDGATAVATNGVMDWHNPGNECVEIGTSRVRLSGAARGLAPPAQSGGYTINEYSVTCSPFGIATGADGALWYTDALNLRMGRMDPTTYVVAQYTIPNTTGGSLHPAGITTGPDGALWFTEFYGNNIGRFDPATQLFTQYPTPTSGSSPLYITSGPDGALWFTEAQASQIGRIDPVTHGRTGATSE